MHCYDEITLDDSPIAQECRGCGERKLLSDFSRDKRGRFGRERRCKECSRRQHRLAREAKVSLGPKPALGYICPICELMNEYSDWCPDHDNATGKAREYLCRQCNTGIGRFKDSPTVLMRALWYLAKHGKIVPEAELRNYWNTWINEGTCSRQGSNLQPQPPDGCDLPLIYESRGKSSISPFI